MARTADRSRHALQSICRIWVRLYTRKLPGAEAQRRRSEIEFDLFEHALEAQIARVSNYRLNAEVLARVLVGVPADISWRRATRRPHPRLALGGIPMSMSKSTSTRLLYVLAGLIVLYAWMGVAASLFMEPEPDEISGTQKLFWMGVPGALHRAADRRARDQIEEPSSWASPDYSWCHRAGVVVLDAPDLRAAPDRCHCARHLGYAAQKRKRVGRLIPQSPTGPGRQSCRPGPVESDQGISDSTSW